MIFLAFYAMLSNAGQLVRLGIPLYLSFLSLSKIFACTLQSIWNAHWLFIFDNIPFVLADDFTASIKLLARLELELQRNQEQ